MAWDLLNEFLRENLSLIENWIVLRDFYLRIKDEFFWDENKNYWEQDKLWELSEIQDLGTLI